MGDATRPTLLPPSDGSFISATPSGLTPNTRSEAEAALTLNSTAQTDSAAPTTPLPYSGHTQGNMFPAGGEAEDGASEAQKAYRRPGGPIRTSSTNYEQALREFRKQSSASSDMSKYNSNDSTSDNAPGQNVLGAGGPVASPTSATVPFPPPGQGVVPLHSGVGTGQSEAVKKGRRSGLTLGDLGRQSSFSEQDMKHIYSAGLMGEVKGDAGYDSAAESKP